MQPNNWLLRLGQKGWAGPPCRVRRVLQDGDVVAGFRVIHAPGHTPGHIMFFRDSDRVCLAGDVLANISFRTGRVGLREPLGVFSVDPLENRRSIQALVELRPTVVCFGHGPPLRNPVLLERFSVWHDWSPTTMPVNLRAGMALSGSRA
jgi:glyoxylase-like metal-dependent hydrolase (beta-lactamase superfamily II)